jgi:hypothetical protein
MSQKFRPNAKVLQSLQAASNECAEFKLKTGVIVCGIGCGLLFSGAGVALMAGVLRAGGHPCWCLPGTGLTILGMSLILLMKRLATLRIWVGPQGILLITLATGKSCRCYRVESPEPAPQVLGTRDPIRDRSPPAVAPAIRAEVGYLRVISERLMQRVT